MEIPPAQVALPKRNATAASTKLSVQVRLYDKRVARESEQLGALRAQHTPASQVTNDSIDQLTKLTASNAALVKNLSVMSEASLHAENKLTEDERKALAPVPGLSTAARFQADSRDGAKMRAALFKQTDPLHTSHASAGKSGVLQNLTSDVQVFLNTECDSLSVPARQIRNLIIGVHAREEGADLAAWQPPILSNFDTASFTPMNRGAKRPIG